MSQLTVGKDVLSFCTKCKLNLGHTIVAMKDAKSIAKVKCNTCGTQQSFKDPSTSSNKQSKTRTKKTSSKPSKVISVADLWMEKMSNTKKKSTPYAMDGKFVVGDIIDHSKFGPGIVENVVDDKIEVIFRHEIKTLVHMKNI
jgi:DNA-directed RNA polymerase subunit M/transcription elongation factor TFIIS